MISFIILLTSAWKTCFSDFSLICFIPTSSYLAGSASSDGGSFLADARAKNKINSLKTKFHPFIYLWQCFMKCIVPVD